MRIISEKHASALWSACWEDEPHFCTYSTSRFDAVSRLLKRFPHQGVAVENLSIDLNASSSDHIEMIVKSKAWAE